MVLRPVVWFCALFGLLAAPSFVAAEALALFGTKAFLDSRPALIDSDRQALIPVSARMGDDQDTPRVASLFTGQARGSLFAPLPARSTTRMGPVLLGPGGADVVHIRQLIGDAESRRNGYDAVQHGARRLPPKTPTQMTIGEIYRWISETPGQPHAIGRYQFIPVTLKRLVNTLGVSPQERFSPQMQDHLADQLLREAGLETVRRGEISRHVFMNNLARIWAGLPTSNGRSYYHGFAGNKASMTWADFDRRMAQIFPS